MKHLQWTHVKPSKSENGHRARHKLFSVKYHFFDFITRKGNPFCVFVMSVTLFFCKTYLCKRCLQWDCLYESEEKKGHFGFHVTGDSNDSGLSLNTGWPPGLLSQWRFCFYTLKIKCILLSSCTAPRYFTEKTWEPSRSKEPLNIFLRLQWRYEYNANVSSVANNAQYKYFIV